VIQLIEFDENAEYPESDGTSTKCILTVLEFASGGELFDFLMFTGCFDEYATRAYFQQMIEGLSAMHSLGIAHRDLKPENLLLNEQYILKIADFGFATSFIDESSPGKIQKMKTACGTKGYLAPELLKGRKYTHKCDIFALGIILFTTYAGFPPFQNAVETDWWWDKLSKGWKYIVASEKQKYQKDKDKHIAAGMAKIELFWKAHERTRQFSNILKNLVERMLHPYGEYRYDIKHIKQHQWYNGKCYSQKELQKYLQQRVRTVVKERAQKIKKQLEEQHATSMEYTTRPLLDPKNKDSPIQRRANELDPQHEFSKYMDHVKDDLFVNTFYQFFTRVNPAQIAARVERIADRAGASVTVSPKNNIILVRCAVAFDDKAGDEDVVFACKQFLTDEQDYQSDEDVGDDESDAAQVHKDDEKSYLVSFKRLKGSHLAYQKAVEDFYNAVELTSAMDLVSMDSVE
jgi:serine/threonine protein kinase